MNLSYRSRFTSKYETYKVIHVDRENNSTSFSLHKKKNLTSSTTLGMQKVKNEQSNAMDIFLAKKEREGLVLAVTVNSS